MTPKYNKQTECWGLWDTFFQAWIYRTPTEPRKFNSKQEAQRYIDQCRP